MKLGIPATAVTLDAKMTIAWSDEPAQSGETISFYAKSENTFFFLNRMHSR
jgi:hypothetical protein